MAAARTPFVVVGESLIDLIQRGDDTFTARVGGGPLNVAIGLARLRCPVTFVTAYGQDSFGAMVDRHLRANGVRTLARRSDPTSLAIASRDGAGNATYEFRFSWSLSRRDVTGAGPAGCVIIGSLAALTDPGRRTVVATARAAQRAGIPVFLDPNIRPRSRYSRTAIKDAVAELVEYATIIKMSSDDMRWLYPDLDPTRPPLEWVDGRRLVVITNAAEGCFATSGHTMLARPAHRVAVVDTIGAGDAFTSALLYGLARRDALRRPAELSVAHLADVLDFAGVAAGLACTVDGAAPPTQEQITAALIARP